MKKVILASASPRRKELLDQMGVAHEVVLSEVDEGQIESMPPGQYVEALAQLKAQAVAKDLIGIENNALIIGADTIVVLGEQILGKPKNPLDAEKMLSILSGKMHVVYTGVSLVNMAKEQVESFTVKSKIYMKEMSKEEIKNYVLTKEPLDKAGSYGIQGKGGVFVEKIEGDYFTVVGLPIAELYQRLKKYIRI